MNWPKFWIIINTVSFAYCVVMAKDCFDEHEILIAHLFIGLAVIIVSSSLMWLSKLK